MKYKSFLLEQSTDHSTTYTSLRLETKKMNISIRKQWFFRKYKSHQYFYVKFMLKLSGHQTTLFCPYLTLCVTFCFIVCVCVYICVSLLVCIVVFEKYVSLSLRMFLVFMLLVTNQCHCVSVFVSFFVLMCVIVCLYVCYWA